MSQLVLSRGVKYRKGVFQRILELIGGRSNRNFEPGLGFLLTSLVIFVGLITVVTLMFSARQVTKGYVLNSLEATNRDLAKNNEIRDMEISQVRALSTIENSFQVRRMISPNTVVFIDVDTAIASK